eukprot:4693818-Amphidinium_carterae.1
MMYDFSIVNPNWNKFRSFPVNYQSTLPGLMTSRSRLIIVNELSLGQMQMSSEAAKSTQAFQSTKSASTKPAEQDRASRTDLVSAIKAKFTLPTGTNIFTRDIYEKEAYVEFPTEFDQRTFLASHRNLSEPIKHSDGSQLWIGPDFSAEDR